MTFAIKQHLNNPNFEAIIVTQGYRVPVEVNVVANGWEVLVTDTHDHFLKPSSYFVPLPSGGGKFEYEVIQTYDIVRVVFKEVV
jgi:hypothetical protein